LRLPAVPAEEAVEQREIDFRLPTVHAKTQKSKERMLNYKLPTVPEEKAEVQRDID